MNYCRTFTRFAALNKAVQRRTFTRPVCLRLLVDRLVNCDFMYVVGLPEDILTESMWPILKNQSWQECKSIVVVDEGHCVIQWKTFRPKYERIGQLRALIPACKLLVLTATASVAMQASICTELMLVNPRFVVGSVDRTNIYIAVTRLSKNNMPVEDVFASCMKLIFVNLRQKRESFDKVVYCKLHYVGLGYELATIEDLHDFVGQYHAHLPDEVKIVNLSHVE
jgi:superfamily II DNA helicase RecQ